MQSSGVGSLDSNSASSSRRLYYNHTHVMFCRSDCTNRPMQSRVPEYTFRRCDFTPYSICNGDCRGSPSVSDTRERSLRGNPQTSTSAHLGARPPSMDRYMPPHAVRYRGARHYNSACLLQRCVSPRLRRGQPSACNPVAELGAFDGDDLPVPSSPSKTTPIQYFVNSTVARSSHAAASVSINSITNMSQREGCT